MKCENYPVVPYGCVRYVRFVGFEEEYVKNIGQVKEVCYKKDSVCKDGVKDGIRSNSVEQKVSKNKKKVWTQLKNGLFAWRLKSVPSRTQSRAKTKIEPEPATKPNSAFKWVPAVANENYLKDTSIKSGSQRTKRKFYFGGDSNEGGLKMVLTRDLSSTSIWDS